MELSRSGIYNRLLLPFLWVVKTSQTKVSQFDLTSAQIGTDNIKKKKKKQYQKKHCQLLNLSVSNPKTQLKVSSL